MIINRRERSRTTLWSSQSSKQCVSTLKKKQLIITSKVVSVEEKCERDNTRAAKLIEGLNIIKKNVKMFNLESHILADILSTGEPATQLHRVEYGQLISGIIMFVNVEKGKSAHHGYIRNSSTWMV